MGLDIYVGTFTRYYRHDWLTVVQRMFPDKVTVVRPDARTDAPSSEEIASAVLGWQHGLGKSLRAGALWSEDDSRPYFTDKPAWDGYGALLLWAAHEDQGMSTSERGGAVVPEKWHQDPSLRKYADPNVQSRYAQLLLGEEMWLPIKAPAVFRSVDAAGNQRVFGNCAQLLAELQLLNERTWKMDDSDPECWQREGVETGAALEPLARFGWEIMWRLAREAVRHELPMVMDY